MKRGFTLIELLAVIVILAIIALIATPIVLDIIEDSKKSSSIRSAEYYLDAVEQAVAAAQLDNKVITSGNYTVMSDGNICLVAPTDNTCSEEDTLEVQLDGERPSSGSITITIEGKVTVSGLNIGGKYYATNSEGNIEEVEQTEKKVICQAVTEATTGNIPTGEFLPGDEYTCEVKEGTSYTFFVLSTDEDNVNLILEANINAQGELIKSENVSDYGMIEWISPEDYEIKSGGSSMYEWLGDNSSYGPVTAMDFLASATAGWTNIDNIEMNYTDNGYGSMMTTGNETIITSALGVETARYENLKARLPYYSELESECPSSLCLSWLSNYMYGYCEGNTIVNILDVAGYWSLSSESGFNAYLVQCGGGFTLLQVNLSYGIRPVISVSKSQIK